VEAVRAYAEEMPLPSKSFDVVMSRLAPHHFADPTRAVREMTRLAKPDGRVAVIDLEGNEDPCLDDLNHELEVLHDPSHVRSYTAARWRYRDGARSAIRRRRRGKKSNRGWPGFPESSRWDWASVPARGNSTFPFVRL
jgi:ubiquinone/menaquinone biosynthesis C-methylase UbiE